jgi:predicted metal-dependent phosphoesterase TrpH
LSTRRIDLHTHSTASDGTVAPARLVADARAAGLDVVALTDHDTTAGWDDAARALPAGLSLVRGAEISCTRDGIALHLLAYLFDPEEPDFAAARAELRTSRVGRAERMVALLQADGVEVTWEQVAAYAGGTVGRPHVAQALMAAGVVGSVDEAFSAAWLGSGGRYFVAKRELDAVEAVRLVRAAGGVTVFAHPAASRRGRTVGDEAFAALAEAGLDGIEVDHLDHDDAERDHLRGVAADLGLLVTGSSDFHGTNKTNQLGAHTTGPDAFEQLVDRAHGLPVLQG